jgi:hypothetical protein
MRGVFSIHGLDALMEGHILPYSLNLIFDLELLPFHVSQFQGVCTRVQLSILNLAFHFRVTALEFGEMRLH